MLDSGQFHVWVTGNEEADRVAKLEASGENSASTYISIFFLRRRFFPISNFAPILNQIFRNRWKGMLEFRPSPSQIA